MIYGDLYLIGISLYEWSNEISITSNDFLSSTKVNELSSEEEENSDPKAPCSPSYLLHHSHIKSSLLLKIFSSCKMLVILKSELNGVLL